MTVWIVNPFDNLPPEGYRPQRYWLMSRAFAEAVKTACDGFEANKSKFMKGGDAQ